MNLFFSEKSKNMAWVFILCLATACGDSDKSSSSGGGGGSGISGRISSLNPQNFNILQENVLRPMGCTECHGWANSEAGVLTKVVPNNPEMSVLYTRIADKSMPPDAEETASVEQIELVRSYINNIVTVTPQTNLELAPTYSSLKVYLYAASCTKCHGEDNNPNTSLKLHTYDSAVANANMSLAFMEDTTSPMPPTGEPPVKPEVLKVFQEWIRLGFPQ